MQNQSQFKSNKEFRKAFSVARKSLRAGYRLGRDAHAKAWDALGKIERYAVDAESHPVSIPVCLYLCKKHGRKTTDFI